MTNGFAVARCGETLYVLVRGLANMTTTPLLDCCLREELASGARVACIDLSECRGMDSTFMGTLVGFHCDFRDRGGRLVIVNPADENAKLLRMLGVSTIIPVLQNQHVPALSFIELEVGGHQTPRQRAELMHGAHQHLVQLSDQNRAKFSPFLQALEKELERHSGR